MSGAYGWNGRYQAPGTPRAPQNPSIPKTPKTTRAPVKVPVLSNLAPLGKSLVVVLLDRTRSMSTWSQEILRRLSTFYVATTSFLGDDLDMVMAGFGDPRCCQGDSLIVPGIGRGPILEDHIAALEPFKQSGGGNQRECAELALLAVDQTIALDGLRHAFIFVITDEMGYDDIDSTTASRFGIHNAVSEPTSAVIARLNLRAHVFTIFSNTQTYGEDHTKVFLPWWQKLLPGAVIPLDDARRVTDVMLGAIAKSIHQYDRYSLLLQSLQGGTQYGPQNIRLVHESLSAISSKDPTPPSKSKVGLMGE